MEQIRTVLFSNEEAKLPTSTLEIFWRCMKHSAMKAFPTQDSGYYKIKHVRTMRTFETDPCYYS